MLILKAGRVLTSGKRATILKSGVLSEAFGEPIRLTSRNGRAALVVGDDAKRSVTLFKSAKTRRVVLNRVEKASGSKKTGV